MAARWFSNFLLNPFVRRVNRRMDMRSVKFCRSTWEVQIFAGSGLPLTGTTSRGPETSGGEVVIHWRPALPSYQCLRRVRSYCPGLCLGAGNKRYRQYCRDPKPTQNYSDDLIAHEELLEKRSRFNNLRIVFTVCIRSPAGSGHTA